jgi:hypothetical protein
MKHPFRKFIGVPFLILALILPFVPGVAGADAPPKYSFTAIDPPGAISGIAFDVSPGGEVVGSYQSADGKSHGFVSRRGGFTTIDYPRDDVTMIRPGGIAPSGDITGFYVAGGIYHGFILTKKGEWSTVDYPGQPNTALTRILPGGALIGCYHNGPDTASMRAFTMNRHENVEMDRPCACPYGATPDGKIVVGYYKEGPNYATNPYLAYVMDNGVFTPFLFPGSLWSMAWDVSPDGSTIVGNYFAGATVHGFVAERRGTSVSNWEFTTIDVPGATLTTIHGCNPAGDLVGRYIDPAGKHHPFMASRTGGR